MPDFIQQLLQHAQAQGSRSTALSPLNWLIATELTGLIAAAQFSAPGWLLGSLVAMSGATLVVFLKTYVTYSTKSPDLLRSEKFTISKMLIEHSAKGDNVAGFISADMIEGLPKLPPPPGQDGGK